MKKSTIHEILNTLPEDFAAEDLIEKIVVVQKIEKGMADIENEKILAHAELRANIIRWQ